MIYIHIGLQKTGTTSLQYILEKMNLLKHPLDKSRYTNSKEKEFYSSGNQKIFRYSKKTNLKNHILKISLIKMLLLVVKILLIHTTN